MGGEGVEGCKLWEIRALAILQILFFILQILFYRFFNRLFLFFISRFLVLPLLRIPFIL